MLKMIRSTDRKSLAGLLQARQASLVEAEEVARHILAEVRREGDRALVRFARQFDRLDLRACGFTVSQEEIRHAYQEVPEGFVKALRVAAQNIRAAARRQLPRPPKMFNRGGVSVGQVIRPLGRVACYVPGGRFPLPSTVLMSVIPAQIAGVKEVLVTPFPGVVCRK